MKTMQETYKGIGFCLLIAIPAFLLGKQFEVIGGPVFAILIGMCLALLVKESGSLQAGIKFTSKKILQYAVILLGFGMNLTDILVKGRQSLPIILATISTSLVISFILYKVMHIPARISTLVGVGSSICGGSAIAATAPVIDADDEEIAQSISVIFLFNVIAALIFPKLGMILGLSNEGFGLFAGTAVNDTSSVTAAAAAWDGLHGSNTLDAATVVKLTRTLAIIPITLVLAVRRARKAESENGGKISLRQVFPFFILFFIGASVITTVAVAAGVPAEVFLPMKDLSKFFIVMAMGAIGLQTDVVKLIKSGAKPILMGLSCWIGITLVSLGLQHVMNIW